MAVCGRVCCDNWLCEGDVFVLFCPINIGDGVTLQVGGERSLVWVSASSQLTSCSRHGNFLPLVSPLTGQTTQDLLLQSLTNSYNGRFVSKKSCWVLFQYMSENVHDKLK